jgi:hypothetical protein
LLRRVPLNVIVRLADSTWLIPIDQVVSVAQQLCDTFPDDQIATIGIVDEQGMTGPVLMRIVGEEVPQWLR